MRSKPKMYARVLAESLEGKPSAGIEKIAKRFKQLLKRRRDLRLTSQIIREFKALLEEKEGKPAQVISASTLPENTKLALQKSFKQKGFHMKESVNSQVIGGTAIFLGRDFLIDGTVRSKIQRIGKQLLQKQ